MSIVATFLRLAKPAFLNVAVALILFFLPIEVLFRLSSWILFKPALDMVNDVAMMILLLALASASLALLVAGVGCALVGLSFPKAAKKIEETVIAVAAIGTLAIILSVLLETSRRWLKSVQLMRSLYDWLYVATGISLKVVAEHLAFFFLPLVIGVVVVAVWKYGLLAAGNVIRSRLANGSNITLILIVSAALVVATNGVVVLDYQEIKTNPIPAPRAGMPNVILLSIDTLTAEDMSLYGYHLPTVPKLEAFAQESYVFDNFFSSSNWTKPSVASFISGQHPITHGVNQLDSYFLQDDQEKNLGQTLKDYGYQTVAIVANGFAHPLDMQISASFSAVTERPIPSDVRGPIVHELLPWLSNFRIHAWVNDLLEPILSPFQAIRESLDHENSLWPPELVFDRAYPFLTNPKPPKFIWAHINPPHAPYLPAAPFKHQFGTFKAFETEKDFEGYGNRYSLKQQTEVDRQRLRYDEFILDTDTRVGGFLEKLKAMGRFDDSIIIITSDHGESFTKGRLRHSGLHLHQPLIHIPLLVHLPHQKEGKRIPFYAGQVDLLPTVLDILDLPIPNWAEGESLKAAMLEGKPTSLPKFSMYLEPDSRFVSPSRGTIAVMQDGWKLVCYLASGKDELYHLASDPSETADLASSNPAQVKKMRDLINTRFKLAN